MAYPSVQTIQSAFINSRCSEVDLATAKHIRKLMEEARGGRGVEDALEEISKLIGGFGHEVINGGDNRGGFWQNAVLAYVNMGDTYDATIYYDTDKGTFGVGAWGGWVEAYERHGVQGTGWQTGVPAACAAIMLARGQVPGAGVYAPEQIDPAPFLALMTEQGTPWGVVDLPADEQLPI